jgi:hypothetical protein
MSEVSSPGLVDHYNRLATSFLFGFLRLHEARLTSLTLGIAFCKLNVARPDRQGDAGAYTDVLDELKSIAFNEYDSFRLRICRELRRAGACIKWNAQAAGLRAACDRAALLPLVGGQPHALQNGRVLQGNGHA